uniref:Uncharacterized protein n=1 Tax=Glossina pallidipes TaxID=7398 RepID=A0A1B0AIG8_GLOPL
MYLISEIIDVKGSYVMDPDTHNPLTTRNFVGRGKVAAAGIHSLESDLFESRAKQLNDKCRFRKDLCFSNCCLDLLVDVVSSLSMPLRAKFDFLHHNCNQKIAKIAFIVTGTNLNSANTEYGIQSCSRSRSRSRSLSIIVFNRFQAALFKIYHQLESCTVSNV